MKSNDVGTDGTNEGIFTIFTRRFSRNDRPRIYILFSLTTHGHAVARIVNCELARLFSTSGDLLSPRRERERERERERKGERKGVRRDRQREWGMFYPTPILPAADCKCRRGKNATAIVAPRCRLIIDNWKTDSGGEWASSA